MSGIKHPYRRIAENTWTISEFRLSSMYILSGTQRTLLIDTGFGIGNFMEELRQLTDLPVTAAVTHGHIDHAGGAGFFEEVFVSPEDLKLISDTVSTADRRNSIRHNTARRGLELTFDPDENVKDWKHQPEWKPLHDNDVIDLGDRPVRVITIPGHTRGSLAFLDEKNRLLFSGDGCTPNLLLAKPLGLNEQFDPDTENALSKYGTSVKTFLDSLWKLKTFSGQFDLNYIGHLDDFEQQPQTNDLLDDLIRCCEKIIAKGIPEDQHPKKPAAEICGSAKITYLPSGILE